MSVGQSVGQLVHVNLFFHAYFAAPRLAETFYAAPTQQYATDLVVYAALLKIYKPGNSTGPEKIFLHL